VWFGDDEPKGEPKFFQDIDEKFAYTEISENWNVSFPRAVENQLDVMHLPFVHRTTIGRGNRTLVKRGGLMITVSRFTLSMKLIEDRYPKNQQRLSNMSQIASSSSYSPTYGKITSQKK